MSVRVFVAADAIAGERATLTGAQLHYVSRVMRLAVGDALTLLDGTGRAYRVRVVTLDRQQLVAEVLETVATPEPPLETTLYQALPKADKLEWILQKATELGVTRVVPLQAARSIAKVDEGKWAAKRERWTSILTEAAEQCERGRVPGLAAPCSPVDVRLAEGELGFVLAERAVAPGLLALLPATPPRALALFVGPEGGWTPGELATLAAAGVRPASLGPRILRAETAAIAALAIVSARYEG